MARKHAQLRVRLSAAQQAADAGPLPNPHPHPNPTLALILTLTLTLTRPNPNSNPNPNPTILFHVQFEHVNPIDDVRTQSISNSHVFYATCDY